MIRGRIRSKSFAFFFGDRAFVLKEVFHDAELRTNLFGLFPLAERGGGREGTARE